MMTNRSWTTALLPTAALIAFLGVERAAAETDTATLSVTARVESGCSLAGGTLAFGVYESGQTEALDAQGTISYINCSGTLTFELDGGQSGDVNNRQMTSADDELTYQLFRNSNRTSIFGQGAQAQQLQLVQPLSGTIDVYGRIPGSQLVSVGDYSDTVNITLTF